MAAFRIHLQKGSNIWICHAMRCLASVLVLEHGERIWDGKGRIKGV